MCPPFTIPLHLFCFIVNVKHTWTPYHTHIHIHTGTRNLFKFPSAFGNYFRLPLIQYLPKAIVSHGLNAGAGAVATHMLATTCARHKWQGKHIRSSLFFRLYKTALLKEDDDGRMAAERKRELERECNNNYEDFPSVSFFLSLSLAHSLSYSPPHTQLCSVRFLLLTITLIWALGNRSTQSHTA